VPTYSASLTLPSLGPTWPKRGRTTPILSKVVEWIGLEILLGHVAANLSVGNDRRVLLGAITQLLPFIGYPRRLNAIQVVNEGTSR
jgi:hypothetical protein